MSTDLALGLLIGMISGIAWAYVLILSRESKQASNENAALKRHLHDLEMDIERGKTP